MWYHAVLPATLQRWIFRIYRSRSWYSIQRSRMMQHWVAWPGWWLYPKIYYPRNTVTYLRNNGKVSWLGIEPATKSRKSNVLTTTYHWSVIANLCRFKSSESQPITEVVALVEHVSSCSNVVAAVVQCEESMTELVQFVGLWLTENAVQRLPTSTNCSSQSVVDDDVMQSCKLSTVHCHTTTTQRPHVTYPPAH